MTGAFFHGKARQTNGPVNSARSTGSRIITNPVLNRPLNAEGWGQDEERLFTLLSSGGDARIALDTGSGLNQYLSAPYPRDVLAYSSSTVSDISAPAFAHLLSLGGDGTRYEDRLADIAARIRSAYGIAVPAEIVFAPSGTDLEYVALAAVFGKESGGVHNVLLGADEIGSGCVHSALGRYFAKETALGHPAQPGQEIDGCGAISTVDIPVRCGKGEAQDSETITAQITNEIETARAANKHCLVHAVHGSKTGLVLPGLSDIQALQSQFGDAVTFVVDACQARITSPAIAEYLAHGAIVLMTGSKFIGAPPFNGWALVPSELCKQSAPLPEGFATIFRRAEWPKEWPGAHGLPSNANLSLALRLEAALYEIERFQRIDLDRVTDIIAVFEAALTKNLIEPLGVKRIVPGGTAVDLPIEMRTLATIDVSHLKGLATFEDAQTLHRAMALEGVRLGQPVKCVATKSGGWGGTLRIGLSMPQISRWADLPMADVSHELAGDMARIKSLLKGLSSAA